MSVWDYVFIITIPGTLVGLLLWAVLLAFDFDIKRIFKRKPKYKVGQKVRVKQLKYDERYGRKEDKLKIWQNMLQYGGCVVTIVDVYHNGMHFNILEDDAEDTWHADMFQSLKIKKEDAFEALLHGHISDEEYTVIMKKRGRRC